MSEVWKGFFAFFLILIQIWIAIFSLGIFTERGIWESEAELIAAQLESQKFSTESYLKCYREVQEKDGEMEVFLYLNDTRIVPISEESNAKRLWEEHQSSIDCVRVVLNYGGYLAKIFPEARIRVSAVAH